MSVTFVLKTLLQVLPEGTASFVNFRFKVFPNLMHIYIIRQFRGAIGHLYFAGVEFAVVLIKNNRGHPFLLVLGEDAYQVEKYFFAIFSRLEQVIKAERE